MCKEHRPIVFDRDMIVSSAEIEDIRSPNPWSCIEMAIRSVLVPIVKNKNKRIADKDNYRPICLSNVFTKVIEKVLLNLCRMRGWF